MSVLFRFLKWVLPPALYRKWAPPKAKKIKAPVPAKKSRIPKMKAAPPAPSPQFGWKRLALLIPVFLLAAKGQSKWMDIRDYHNINEGWVYFLAAIALFIVVLWPFHQERLQREPLPFPLEAGILAFLFGIAAFFRLFRLDQMPPGVFYDQGFMGWASLRILHEGWHPFWVEEPLHCSSLLFYQLAAWFALFKPSPAGFFSYFVFMSLLSFGFIYWTFRQLAGPRMALLAFYILAVMRWNVNFSRNGFPSIQVLFYMFGTISFLLYGLRNRKTWPFLASAVFFSLGFYTYQAYKVVPLLLLVLALYKLCVDGWESIRVHGRGIVAFGCVVLILVTPFFYVSYKNKNLGLRETYLNIFAEMKERHSVSPLVDMVTRTAKMFNREGDNNERHNIPNYRMLDDVTAALFVLGFFYALRLVQRRKYFFAVAGFLVMCLPCVLSQDAAHANRMMGTTPFLAFLAAVPIAAIWGRVRHQWGGTGEAVFLLVLMEPLFLMGLQNYNVYFNVQAFNHSMWNTGLWEGYSVPATKIGEEIGKDGDKYDFFLFKNAQNDPTVDFLGYFHRDRMKIMTALKDLAPFDIEKGRGACYVLTREYEGLLGVLKAIYPTVQAEEIRSPSGQTIVTFFKVTPEQAEAAQGLDGTIDGVAKHFASFPKDLPPGPYRGVFQGQVFVNSFGKYRFTPESKGKVSLKIGGRQVRPNVPLGLARGFYSVEVNWAAPVGPADLKLEASEEAGPTTFLGPGNLTVLPLNRGLKGYFYGNERGAGSPSIVEWDPVLNFTGGEDFYYVFAQLFAKWEGTISAPQAGEYSFWGQTNEFGKLEVDGVELFDFGPNKSAKVSLKAGPHKIQAYFRKVLGPSFTLYWKTPGSDDFTVVPIGAFGETKPESPL